MNQVKMSENCNVPQDIKNQHLFDSSDWNVYDKQITNLCVGAPGPDLLQNCCNIFEKATKHRMELELKSNGFLFQYGSAIGNYEPRKQLSKFLSKAYGSPVSCQDLVLTSGATDGFLLILSALINLDGVVIVDEVTYMIALDVLRQFPTLKVVPVKLKKDGVDTEELRELFKKNKGTKSTDKLFWGIYYTIPTFHNPTGIVFSEETCKKLIEIAREFDILIVCDDVYNLLSYKEDIMPKRLFEYDNITDDTYRGNVISNGSFSKIVAPGCRMGWMECPPNCVKAFKNSGVLNSGGCPANYTSGIMQSIIELGLAETHIKMMYDNYKSRMLAVSDILKKDLPVECSFIEPSGGYFIWISLPQNQDAALFNKYCCDKYGIRVNPGSRFSLTGGWENSFRITIAFHTKEVLVDAARKICLAIKEYCKLQ